MKTFGINKRSRHLKEADDYNNLFEYFLKLSLYFIDKFLDFDLLD